MEKSLISLLLLLSFNTTVYGLVGNYNIQALTSAYKIVDGQVVICKQEEAKKMAPDWMANLSGEVCGSDDLSGFQTHMYSFRSDSARWDVERLIAGGTPTEEDLESMKNYCHAFANYFTATDGDDENPRCETIDPTEEQLESFKAACAELKTSLQRNESHIQANNQIRNSHVIAYRDIIERFDSLAKEQRSFMSDPFLMNIGGNDAASDQFQCLGENRSRFLTSCGPENNFLAVSRQLCNSSNGEVDENGNPKFCIQNTDSIPDYVQSSERDQETQEQLTTAEQNEMFAQATNFSRALILSDTAPEDARSEFRSHLSKYLVNSNTGVVGDEDAENYNRELMLKWSTTQGQGEVREIVDDNDDYRTPVDYFKANLKWGCQLEEADDEMATEGCTEMSEMDRQRASMRLMANFRELDNSLNAYERNYRIFRLVDAVRKNAQERESDPSIPLFQPSTADETALREAGYLDRPYLKSRITDDQTPAQAFINVLLSEIGIGEGAPRGESMASIRARGAASTNSEVELSALVDPDLIGNATDAQKERLAGLARSYMLFQTFAQRDKEASVSSCTELRDEMTNLCSNIQANRPTVAPSESALCLNLMIDPAHRDRFTQVWQAHGMDENQIASQRYIGIGYACLTASEAFNRDEQIAQDDLADRLAGRDPQDDIGEIQSGIIEQGTEGARDNGDMGARVAQDMILNNNDIAPDMENDPFRGIVPHEAIGRTNLFNPVSGGHSADHEVDSAVLADGAGGTGGLNAIGSNNGVVGGNGQALGSGIAGMNTQGMLRPDGTIVGADGAIQNIEDTIDATDPTMAPYLDRIEELKANLSALERQLAAAPGSNDQAAAPSEELLALQKQIEEEREALDRLRKEMATRVAAARAPASTPAAQGVDVNVATTYSGGPSEVSAPSEEVADESSVAEAFTPSAASYTAGGTVAPKGVASESSGYDGSLLYTSASGYEQYGDPIEILVNDIEGRVVQNVNLNLLSVNEPVYKEIGDNRYLRYTLLANGEIEIKNIVLSDDENNPELIAQEEDDNKRDGPVTRYDAFKKL